MKKALVLVALAVGFLAGAGHAAVERQTLRGHVPPEVANLPPSGRLDGAQQLKLAIGLASRDEVGLDEFVREVSDPASPNYRHYLSPAAFTERFGPTEQDYEALIQFAQTNGLIVTRRHANRVVLDVEGPVTNIEQAFQVKLLTYQHPTEARTFFAPDAEPSLPANLPVSHISGLDNFTLPHPKIRHHSVSESGGAGPRLGSAPGGQLWGNDFRDAYAPGTTLTGAGQNVGLLEFEGFYPTDISSYENDIGMSAIGRPQLIVVTVGTNAAPNQEGDNGEECSGDIEMAVSMAPGLNAVYIFEDGLPVTNPHFDDILESMVTYTNILQFSCSWGGSTLQDPASELLWKQMITQGQTFFDASGDAGAFVGAVQFPSDSPSIIQVGGTTLSDGSAPAYAWTGEIVWAWDSGPTVSASLATSSAGGISTYYPIPNWQTNLSTTLNKGSKAWRNFPDVAANADNCYLYTDAGAKQGGWGGTSFASPLWAGLTALINQQAAANGQPPVGFLNPALYALAAGTNYTHCFHDITSGNNTWKRSSNLYYAVTGYDLCCGLGTPYGTNLINALAPSQPVSVALSVVRDGGANFVFNFPAAIGQSYQVQATGNLSAGSWVSSGGPITGTGATVSVTNSAVGTTQQFFRVIVTR